MQLHKTPATFINKPKGRAGVQLKHALERASLAEAALVKERAERYKLEAKIKNQLTGPNSAVKMVFFKSLGRVLCSS